MDINSTMDSSAPKGCGCSFCQNGDSGPIAPLENDFGSLYDYNGGGASSAPTSYGSTQVMVDQLTTGYWGGTGRQWDAATVTYSLSNEYTSAEKASFRMAFDMWSDVADIQFQEVGSGAHITILEGDDGGAWSGYNTYSYGNWPNYQTLESNTISIDTDAWSALYGIGGYGVQTILHEIGHSIGLGHQGNYNGSVDYDNDVIYLNDNRQYSIMSYNNANLLGTDHWASDGVWDYAATPLLYDIAAAQQLYGANTTTRTGNTTYGFNITGDVAFSQFDLSQNEAPFAIWDAGGIDTLDLSGYSSNQTITLVEGEFTSAGSMTNNIVIAYGAVIENAVGGSGNDQLYGNAANNILTGGLGNDQFFASTGSDTLNGDGGTDTANYSFNLSEFIVSIVDSVTLTLQNIAQGWTDTLSTIESFIFNDGTRTFADLEAAAFVPSTYSSFFKDGGNKYYHQSTSLGSETVTANDLGYGGTTGNIATYDRSAGGLDVTILNANAPARFFLYGTNDTDDTMTVSGTHASMGVVFSGYGGNDSITISGIGGDSTLYGGAGNDTLTGGNGNDTIRGEADNDIINGGIGADKLYGDAGDDTINGGAGNDIISGGTGVDTIDAGDNNDYIYGNAGNDILSGGAGIDAIYGGDNDDTINGGDGIDYLFGENGADTVNGDAGNDIIYGADGFDILNGGAGNDSIYGGNHNDTINGGDDNDSIRGEAGNDTIHGDAGDDTIWGDGDNDFLYGDAGSDRLYGGFGNDNIWGGTENDVISGDAGIDTLRGEAGNDTIYGGSDADTIYGGDDNDQVYGGTGNDMIYGGNGNDGLRGDSGADTIYGNDGNDYIYGLADNDTIYGGAGTDTIYGGGGLDTYVFEVEGMDGTIDYVKDFSNADGERLDISDLLTGFTPGSSDITDFLIFNAPNGAGDVSVGVDRDGTGGTYGTTWIAKLSTGGVALDAQTLYDNGQILV